MTLSEYSILKEQVIRNVANSENYSNLLKKLKDFYHADIDSERKFEKINSIGQLINILEIRDLVSEDNLGPLKDICWRLKDQELLKRISEFETRHAPKEYVNYYVKTQENLSKEPQKISEIKANVVHHHPFSLDIVNQTEKKGRIREAIREGIGCFWKDLGRNLNIQEGRIQEIDEKYNNISDKIEELMNVFEKRVDKQRWFMILCRALERSRRKDLSKYLNEIMSMSL
ncbi:unnamed protein product, partial [Brenthis ino]